MKTNLSSKIRLIIANFSNRERAVFIGAACLFLIGAFGGLVRLSNIWTTPMPVHGGTYREGIIGSPRFINPVLANTDADRDLTALVYNGLVRMDQNGDPVPDLAESWIISADGRTYTVTLKPKLSFHDGKKLTTHDVTFTIEKIQDPVLKSPLRVAFDGVTATATDERTITFTLSKPYAGFLSALSVGILPEHIWGDSFDESWATDEHNTNPVGSGPYRVTSVSRSSIGVPVSITLHSFAKFALGRPYITDFIIKSYQNKSDAYDAFDSGSIDGLAAVDSSNVAGLSGDASIITTPLPRVFGLFMNPTKNKIFAETAVVSAINNAIDKTAITDAVFAGYAHPLNGPLPSMTDASGDYATKKALAEKTLDASGWKLNADGIREKAKQILSFSISTANTPELQESAQLVADQLAQIGIRADVKVFEIGALNGQVIRGRDYEALLFGEIIRHDTDLYAFWHSSQKTDPGLNITGYASARVDGLLESALREPDTAKRMAIYEQVKAELAKTASVAFLYAPDFVYLINDKFHNTIVPPLANPGDRFALVYEWYREMNRVWNVFVPR